MKKTYEHITDAERRSIERGLHAGLSCRAIANRLSRSPNTIAVEIRTNRVNGIYTARKANHKASVRRKYAKVQCMKVAMDKQLKRYVIRHIVDEQSPQGISRRLKQIDTVVTYASTKAIYKFVHSVHGRQIERHLYSRRVKKKGGPKRTTVRVGEQSKRRVDTRSVRANRREEFGHYEGDFVESGKDGTGSLLVLVERKTRRVFVRYVADRGTTAVNTLLASTLAACVVRSVTLDNDISFQKHETLSQLLVAPIFFTHPYTSQEKGAVENRNKAIRQHFPKRTDFSWVSAGDIARVERYLNTRFMVCLDGRTPREVWEREVAKEECRAKRDTMKKHAARVVSS